MIIKDSFGRPITSIRISITSRCNLNCAYCHREGIKNAESEMEPEEIKRVIEVCSGFGIRKVKITGGEPLIRKDVVDIVDRINSIEKIREISMTTNGLLLEKYALKLKEAGLKRVNISFDTLNAEKFRKITRGGDLSRVISGIEAAHEAGLKPIKLNMVAMNGINIEEIEQMLEFASKYDAILQLIGLMRNEYSKNFFDSYYYDLREIEKEIEKRARKVITRKTMHGRRRYVLQKGVVEVVFPMHNSSFCAHCTRLRITSDGKFKPCLMRENNHVDFLTAMRNGASNEEIKELFRKAVMLRKPYFMSDAKAEKQNSETKIL